MPFVEETPLEDVMKYIKSASKKGPDDPGIQIDFDREGLQKADRNLATDDQAHRLFEGVPILRQASGCF